MISKISGTLTARGENSIEIAVGGLTYEIQVPVVVYKDLESAPLGEPLALETIYYLQVEQTRATPVLLGFQNSIQREFFEKLLLVPRMGPKGALGAFAMPVSTLAAAIESANYSRLHTLPGVGKQKAKDMVATLQGKLAKFALMQDAELGQKAAGLPHGDVEDEALQLLVMLGHKRSEAEKLVADALSAEPATPDAESLVRVIYRLKQERR